MAKHKNPGWRFGRTKRLRDLSGSSQMLHHGELISAYAKFCHARVIVEIGVQHGNTTSHLCEAASVTGGKVYGYDFFPEGKETIGAYDKEDQKYPMEPVRQRLIDEGHSPSLFKLRKIDSQSPEFLDVLKKDIGWANHDTKRGGLIDLAFIDGCHSYAGAKNDFINIYPLLARDGSIFFHDTFSHVGLRKLVLDLYEELNDGTYDIINLPYGHGKKRVGVTILTKRSYPLSWKPDPLNGRGDHDLRGGIINTEHDKDMDTLGVYKAEHKWYLEQLKKNKKEE